MTPTIEIPVVLVIPVETLSEYETPEPIAYKNTCRVDICDKCCSLVFRSLRTRHDNSLHKDEL